LVAEVRLPGGTQAIGAYDKFLAGIPFLSDRERCTLTIAGDEVVDNLVTHGEVGQAGIHVRIRKTASCILFMALVESHASFREFAQRFKNGLLPGPRFNKHLGRWHGLGLTMCRNLCTRIVYRAGEYTDRVFLEFRTDPGSCTD